MEFYASLRHVGITVSSFFSLCFPRITLPHEYLNEIINILNSGFYYILLHPSSELLTVEWLYSNQLSRAFVASITLADFYLSLPPGSLRKLQEFLRGVREPWQIFSTLRSEQTIKAKEIFSYIITFSDEPFSFFFFFKMFFKYSKQLSKMFEESSKTLNRNWGEYGKILELLIRFQVSYHR